MTDAAVKAVGSIKRTLPNGICPTGFAQREPPGRDGKICTIETIERDKIRPVSEAIERGGVRPAGSVERGKICPVGSVEHGRIRPAGSVERGKIRSSCMI